ncbi:uncharacterized protein ARMOST_06247 [Armillaria ostoyae]|uniref:Uncharacterized protein n=1 Tax=Armillaria ostoyae TaxID=47428 RepID=A0A284R2I5_ARMOS|nr:uncharacterized protein ARMOST_06247 [Armillaria ostoyae]
MKPAPLLASVKGKKVKMTTQPTPTLSSNKMRSKKPNKKPRNPVRITMPPLQQPVHRPNCPHKLVSSDDEDTIASHQQQQVSENEEENDSEAEETAENQDIDLQKLEKRKRSPTAHGIIESLAEDGKDDAKDDSDSKTKEPETPENFQFMHAYMHITTFLFPLIRCLCIHT